MTNQGTATVNRQNRAVETAALHAPAALTIDLGALRQNYRKLRKAAPDADCAAVVKADAYGTGAVRSAKALAEEGCDTFFVATLDEAGEIREAVPKAVLYVLNGVFLGTCPHFVAVNARPVLGSLPEIQEWADFNSGQSTRLPAALHIDTGMNRHGLSGDDIDAVANDPAILKSFEVSLVMSHLACADDPAHPKNHEQRLAFDRLKARLPDAPASLANSAGIFLGPEFHYDMVRPGIALYGGKALGRSSDAMATVVHLHGRIVQVRPARKGETVGYGAAHALTRPSRIAVVAVGYADGYARTLGSNDVKTGAIGYISGHRAPIVGRVSMDLITLDVTGRSRRIRSSGRHGGIAGGACRIGRSRPDRRNNRLRDPHPPGPPASTDLSRRLNPQVWNRHGQAIANLCLPRMRRH